MRRFRVLAQSMVFAATASLSACPQDSLPQIEFQEVKAITHLSYDEILDLLEKIESGEIEENATAADLERINQWIAFLAKEGSLDADVFALECDIAALLNGGERDWEYAFAFGQDDYRSVTAMTGESGEIVFCKGWASKQWHQTKKFVKKHKKAIIIGAVIVVAATVVIVAVAASSTSVIAAGAAAAAAAANEAASAEPAHGIKSTLNEQIASFKENLAKEPFFQDFDSHTQRLSLEENGRTLGSLFAHESFRHLERQFSDPSPHFGHQAIDRTFATDYSSMYPASSRDLDFNALAFQMRGEKALTSGYLNQAVEDLSRSIELDPANPLPLLERGVAHFGLGDYERSMEDYREYAAQTQKANPLSVADFSLGFAKGLPKGIYESGEGLLLFLTDFIKHPIHTSEQIIDSITALVNLVRSDEWGVVAEALSPETHQLVTQWDSLSSDQRGELAGYAVGKHGADILIPGALAKVASKSAKSAQELTAVCKNLQIAQETLLLESVACSGSSIHIAEAIQAGQKTIALAENLGFPVQEIACLKQAGNLEGVVANTCEHIAKNPMLRESYELFKRAEGFLEPYSKGFLPEIQVRELIHQTGIRTFPKPAGVPENFKVRITDSGAGMEYVHPTNPHTRIRIMPGKPYSPNPSQQNPYVIYKLHGHSRDKFGKIVDASSPEAHIPLGEFVYTEA